MGILAYILLSLVLLPLLAAYVYCKLAFQHWSRRGVVTIPPTVFFGNAKDVILQRLDLGNTFGKAYLKLKAAGQKAFGGFYFFTKPILLIYDPDLIKQVLVKDFRSFADRGNYMNMDIDPLSGDLFGLKGDRWKNLRAKMTPSFTAAKMKHMFETMLECSKQLEPILEESSAARKTLDIRDLMGRFSTDIIGACAFGLECNTLQQPDNEFRKYGKKMFGASLLQGMKSYLAFVVPEIMYFFRIPFNSFDVRQFYTKTVQETITQREANSSNRKDMLNVLMQLKETIDQADESKDDQVMNTSLGETKISLTLEDLVAQAYIVFIAGFEPSSTALTFLLYELAENQKLQNKLREEITQTWNKCHGKITYEVVMEMTYMDKCIDETLRKYIPVPILTRVCTQDYQLPDSDVVLKTGDFVVIPIRAIHNDPRYYPDPDVFDPERFNEENTAKRHPFTYLPFGGGQRVCIGMRFGRFQTKVGLLALLKNYQFTLNPKTKIPIVLDPKSFIASAIDSIWLDLKKIS